MSVAYRWSLAPQPEAAAEARRAIREQCADLPADVLDSAVLLTSELVTNAVRHGSGEIQCQLLAGEGQLRLEVSDATTDYPFAQNIPPYAESGRGLRIVSALATRWGVSWAPSRAGKSVWFELDIGGG